MSSLHVSGESVRGGHILHVDGDASQIRRIQDMLRKKFDLTRDDTLSPECPEEKTRYFIRTDMPCEELVALTLQAAKP